MTVSTAFSCKEISLGSVYAGLAFSNTRTTACHSISYPLTLLHGIDHGIAAAITLGSVLQLNLPSLIEPERLFAAYGAESVEEVQGVIQRLFALFNIPMRLREFGVKADDIPAIVEGSYTKERMDNTPVALSEVQVHSILSGIL